MLSRIQILILDQTDWCAIDRRQLDSYTISRPLRIVPYPLASAGESGLVVKSSALVTDRCGLVGRTLGMHYVWSLDS